MLRDPRIVWARTSWTTIGNTVAGIGVVVLLSVGYIRFRIWLDRLTGSGAFRDGFGTWDAVGLCGVALLVAGGSLVTLRNWVGVGPRGVSFRSWLRHGEYPWATIESIEVGNPAEPRFAYIMVRVGAERVQAVRLPAFNSIAPADLAEALRRKRRVYASRNHGGI